MGYSINNSSCNILAKWIATWQQNQIPFTENFLFPKTKFGLPVKYLMPSVIVVDKNQWVQNTWNGWSCHTLHTLGHWDFLHPKTWLPAFATTLYKSTTITSAGWLAIVIYMYICGHSKTLVVNHWTVRLFHSSLLLLKSAVPL